MKRACRANASQQRDMHGHLWPRKSQTEYYPGFAAFFISQSFQTVQVSERSMAITLKRQISDQLRGARISRFGRKLKAMFRVLFYSIFIFGGKMSFSSQGNLFSPKPGLISHSICEVQLQNPSFRPLAHLS